MAQIREPQGRHKHGVSHIGKSSIVAQTGRERRLGRGILKASATTAPK